MIKEKECQTSKTLKELLNRGLIPVAFVNALVIKKNNTLNKKVEETYYQSIHYLQDVVPVRTSSLPISKMFDYEKIYESLP